MTALINLALVMILPLTAFGLAIVLATYLGVE
jgi:hypothetical protein